MYWIIESIHETAAGPLILLRLALSGALLWKFVIETNRGYFNYFRPHTYLYAIYQAPRRGRGVLKEWMWKSLYVLKFPAALGLGFGLYTVPSLILLMLWLLLEMKIYFKYHVNFMLLLCVCFLFAPVARNHGPMDAANARESTVPFILISLTLSLMYLITALRKMNAQFLSGEVVSRTLHAVRTQRRRHFDMLIPKSLVPFLVTSAGGPTRALSLLMYVTILIELSLPFTLSVPSLWSYAAVAGLLLHTGFTLMFPITLLHFSVLTVAGYLTFVP